MTLLNSRPSGYQKSLEDETVCGWFNSLARRYNAGRTGVRGTALPSVGTLSLTTQHSANHYIPWRSQNMDTHTHTHNSYMVSWYPLSSSRNLKHITFLDRRFPRWQLLDVEQSLQHSGRRFCLLFWGNDWHAENQSFVKARNRSEVMRWPAFGSFSCLAIKQTNKKMT